MTLFCFYLISRQRTYSMVQISIEDTPHLFTIRLTTYETFIQEIVQRTGTTKILPISYFDRNRNVFILLNGENLEPIQRKTHVKLRLGSTDFVPYEGEVNSKGEKHGHGLYRWPNGRTYVGDWHENQMHGDGIESWPNGSKYQGQFKANKRHGHGTFNWPDGRQYIGRKSVTFWEDFQISNVEKGEYRNDCRHGYGVCTFPNGYKYEGQWFEGKKHGHGMEIFPDGHRFNGIFENDKPVRKSSE